MHVNLRCLHSRWMNNNGLPTSYGLYMRQSDYRRHWLKEGQALKRAAMQTLFTRGLRGEAREGNRDRTGAGELDGWTPGPVR